MHFDLNTKPRMAWSGQSIVLASGQRCLYYGACYSPDACRSNVRVCQDEVAVQTKPNMKTSISHSSDCRYVSHHPFSEPQRSQMTEHDDWRRSNGHSWSDRCLHRHCQPNHRYWSRSQDARGLPPMLRDLCDKLPAIEKVLELVGDNCEAGRSPRARASGWDRCCSSVRGTWRSSMTSSGRPVRRMRTIAASASGEKNGRWLSGERARCRSCCQSSRTT